MINSHALPPRPFASTSKCRDIATKIKDLVYNDPSHQVSFDQLLYILNHVADDPRCPSPQNCPPPAINRWVDCVAAVIRMKRVFAAMGTLGSNLQRQNKHAMTCSVLIAANRVQGSLIMDNPAANMKLLVQLLPHKDDDCRRDWIRDCKALLSAFNNGQSRHICKDYENLHRQS